MAKNFFELFAIKPSFDVDMDVLTHRYRLLQKEFHPDRYASSSDRERMLAMQHAAKLNDAYNTLKDPLKRGTYLLSLSSDREEQNLSEKSSIKDDSFLTEQFELREELATIKRSPGDSGKLVDFIEKIDDSMDKSIQRLSTLFKDTSPENLNAIETVLNKMQFMTKLRQEALLIEDELLD